MFLNKGKRQCSQVSGAPQWPAECRWRAPFSSASRPGDNYERGIEESLAKPIRPTQRERVGSFASCRQMSSGSRQRISRMELLANNGTASMARVAGPEGRPVGTNTLS